MNGIIAVEQENGLNQKHPKLRVAKARAGDAAWYAECMAWLAGVGPQDEVTVKLKLKNWVPEYQPESASA